MGDHEFLSDILVTALEGGINHWADIRDYQHNQPGNGDLIVVTAEINANNGYGWQSVNANTVKVGVNRVLNSNFRINPTIRAAIFQADRENDASNIDSHCADAILQAGMFGILVYG